MSHSFYSASQAPRWVACTASINHNKDTQSSQVMEEGKIAHDLCELMITNKKINFDNYNDEMIFHANNYMQYIQIKA